MLSKVAIIVASVRSKLSSALVKPAGINWVSEVIGDGLRTFRPQPLEENEIRRKLFGTEGLKSVEFELTDNNINMSCHKARIHKNTTNFLRSSMLCKGIYVIRPFQAYSVTECTKYSRATTRFDDSQTKEVLDEDELGRWEGSKAETEKQGELQATWRG